MAVRVRALRRGGFSGCSIGMASTPGLCRSLKSPLPQASHVMRVCENYFLILNTSAAGAGRHAQALKTREFHQ